MKSQGIRRAQAPPPIPKSKRRVDRAVNSTEDAFYDEPFELPADDYYPS